MGVQTLRELRNKIKMLLIDNTLSLSTYRPDMENIIINLDNATASISKAIADRDAELIQYLESRKKEPVKDMFESGYETGISDAILAIKERSEG